MVLSLLKGEKGIEYPGSSQDTRNMHTGSNRNEFSACMFIGRQMSGALQ